MNPNPNYKISVPEPCHEDWNKMTPDEKGAFCGSCQKSVVDFSNKSPEEIGSILKASAGQKVCGRFKPSQLSRPNAEKAVNTLAGKRAMVAFAYALFLVFGSTLFSCNTNNDKIMGDMVAIEQPVKNPVKEEEMIMGSVAAPIHPGDSTQQIIPVPEDLFPIMGDVSYDPYDTLVAEPVLPDSIVPLAPDTIFEHFTMGLIAYDYVIGDQPVQQLDSTLIPEQPDNTPDVIKDIPEVNTGLKLEVFPNPGREETNIRYTVKEKGNVSLEVFDLSGKKIKTLVKDQSHYPGTYVNNFDLSGLGTGTYLCVFSSGDKKTSTKLQVVK